MKSLFEKHGGTYRREIDYLIPNLSLPVGERPVGVYGSGICNIYKSIED